MLIILLQGRPTHQSRWKTLANVLMMVPWNPSPKRQRVSGNAASTSSAALADPIDSKQFANAEVSFAGFVMENDAENFECFARDGHECLITKAGHPIKMTHIFSCSAT